MKRRTLTATAIALAMLGTLQPANQAVAHDFNQHSEHRWLGPCRALVQHSFGQESANAFTINAGGDCFDPWRWLTAEAKEYVTSSTNGQTSTQGGFVQDGHNLNLDSVHRFCTLFCGAGTFTTTMF